MNEEFKKGDRVLVRVNDCMEWKLKTLESASEKLIYPFQCEDGGTWSQCRHIDDFRTGDKVQVRDEDKDEWNDAVYGCYIVGDDYVHCAMVEVRGQHETFIQCRWHPSMPWADKEEIIDEPHWVRAIFRHLDAIEAKLNEK